MKETPSKRIDFVDLTKGVCIILVVMTHIGGAFEQLDRGSMLSCFRMHCIFLYQEFSLNHTKLYQDSFFGK